MRVNGIKNNSKLKPEQAETKKEKETHNKLSQWKKTVTNMVDTAKVCE